LGTRFQKTNQGQTPRSKLSYFNKLRACLNQAYEEQIIPTNPLRGIEGFKPEEGTRMYLTLDEVRKLAKTECEYPQIKAAFLFSCLTGLRRSDVLRLTWGDIHKQGDFTRIIFRQKKTSGQEYLDIYRVAVEQYYGLPDLDEDQSGQIRGFKKYVDSKYSEVCNLINIEWLDCIKGTGNNFRNVNLPRQNEFFSNYFDPSKRLVVIISDALRYETAVELVEKLGKEKHTTSIAPMLSLLPSETKFCKPALYPHQDLELKGDNMTVDGKIISSTALRTDQLRKYRHDAVCVNFSDVSSQISSHRELFKRQLVYVLHDMIDDKSHGQTAKEVANNCREAIAELAKFVYSLHMTLNCYNVIITSDHGFLFNDLKFEDKDKISIKEESIDSTSRYYLTHISDNVEGIAKFNMADSTPIETEEETYIATPLGTNRFAAPGGYVYTHGGASLQEMIVPVIMSNRRDTNSKQKVNVMLKTANLSLVSSQLRFQLIQKEAVSLDVVSRTVLCRLYEGDRQVADEVKVPFDSTDANNISKRTYDVCLRLSESISGGLLQLRIYDADDKINPMLKETVKNNTIIEQDF